MRTYKVIELFSGVGAQRMALKRLEKKNPNSESQLYKQAGNSIVVDVLEAIFENMLTETKTVRQCKLGEW